MKALHFGAGNIGRGFIGLNLVKSGYDVTFVDNNQSLIEEINQRKTSQVDFVGDNHYSEVVSNVAAINIADEAGVIMLISQADIITTAIGPNILPFITVVIAKGLKQRFTSTNKTINVIACENMAQGSTMLKGYIMSHLDVVSRERVAEMTGFPDAAVDRIVPLQSNTDMLTVKTEPYQEWDINRTQFKGAVPEIRGVTWVDDLTPYIERKLYTINTSHTAIAWLGNIYGKKTIRAALQDNKVLNIVKQVLAETAAFLIARHGLDKKTHHEYIETTLSRFSNPYIDDDVARVGRSPVRKISPQERLILPALGVLKLGIPPEGLATAIAASFLFNRPDDNESVELQRYLNQHDIADGITHFTGLALTHPLHRLIVKKYNELCQSTH